MGNASSNIRGRMRNGVSMIRVVSDLENMRGGMGSGVMRESEKVRESDSEPRPRRSPFPWSRSRRPLVSLLHSYKRELDAQDCTHYVNLCDYHFGVVASGKQESAG